MAKEIGTVSAGTAEEGTHGERHLARGEGIAMRLWSEDPMEVECKEPTTRDYETVGYVVAGSARLISGDHNVTLETGDSWIVPAGVSHAYHILERFVAVEATAPPYPAS